MYYLVEKRKSNTRRRRADGRAEKQEGRRFWHERDLSPPLWSDRIYINQADAAEKSWQVQLMAAIYSRARATISWLGLSSEDSKLALETPIKLNKKTSRCHWSIQETMEGGAATGTIKKSVLQLTRDRSRWNVVANICARLYWSRIWIFQEMACAIDKIFPMW
jgi:heterokaryon incompatibility protein (HET)